MKTQLAAVALFTISSTAPAAGPADFSGTWVFNPSQSENVGMMSAMQWTAIVQQSAKRLSQRDDTVFAGQHQTREVHYDLMGRDVLNPGPMGESCTTQTKWDGRALVTTWTSEGAVAGTKVVKLETRSLSADGRTMRLESRRGDNPPVVMVFDKK